MPTKSYYAKYSSDQLKKELAAEKSYLISTKETVRDARQDLKEALKDQADSVKEIALINTALKAALAKEKTTKAKKPLTLPKSFKGWAITINKGKKNCSFGCGAVTVNASDITSFLNIVNRVEQNFAGKKEDFYKFHARTIDVANSLRRDIIVKSIERGDGTNYTISRENGKYVFGCGDVTVTQSQLNHYYYIWAYISKGIMHTSVANFTKEYEDTKTFANLLLKNLSSLK